MKPDVGRVLGVLFDAGNTLIYDPVGPQETLRKILIDRGFSFLPEKISRAWEKVQGYWEKKYKELDPSWNDEIALDIDTFLLRELGLRGDVVKEAEYMVENWINYTNPVLFPDVQPCLSWLKSRSLKLGVVSNSKNENELTQLLSKVEIDRSFECIISSGTVGHQKPNPMIFEVACRRIGLNPADLLHVGDSYDADILGARAAGITPVLIDREGKHSGRDCMTVSSLIDLKELLPKTNVSPE